MNSSRFFLLNLALAFYNVGTIWAHEVDMMSSQLSLPQIGPSQAGLIHVDIAGLRNDRGQVLCALYSSADGFSKDSKKAIARATSAIAHEHAVCEFSAIAPGTYAVSVFHDENSNGKLDTNFMGIPREGVGASNKAKGHLGPPKFHDALIPFFRRSSRSANQHQLLVGRPVCQKSEWAQSPAF